MNIEEKNYLWQHFVFNALSQVLSGPVPIDDTGL